MRHHDHTLVRGAARSPWTLRSRPSLFWSTYIGPKEIKTLGGAPERRPEQRGIRGDFLVKFCLARSKALIPDGKYLGVPSLSWGFARGFAAHHGDAAVCIRARNV